MSSASILTIYSLSHNLIKEQLDYALKNPQLDVISCLVNYSGKEDGNTDYGRGYKHYVKWTNKILTATDHFTNRFADAPLAHPTLLCKKAIFNKFGYYKEENLPEDFELWLRWMDQGVSFGKCPAILFDWYDSPDRISRSSSNYSSDKFFEIKAIYLAKFLEKHQGKRIWIWGFGKDVFRRSEFLLSNQIKITGYVDLKERPKSIRHVIPIGMVKKTDRDFYLVYLSDRLGKEKIADFFKEKDMIAGKHFLFMS